MGALYIGFSILCTFNVVTGCFVDKAVKAASLDEERMMMEEIEKRKKWLLDLKMIFEQADKDNSRYVDKKEFMDVTKDAKVKYYFQKFGLDLEVDDPAGIYEFLDMDNDGRVDVDEFISALQHLHGPARNVDVARIQHALKRNLHITEMMQHTMEEIRFASPTIVRVDEPATRLALVTGQGLVEKM